MCIWHSYGNQVGATAPRFVEGTGALPRAKLGDFGLSRPWGPAFQMDSTGVGFYVPMFHITQLLGMSSPTDMAEGDVQTPQGTFTNPCSNGMSMEFLGP